MKNPTLRPAEASDRAGILELFQTVFGKERTADEWDWLFQQGPVGPADLIIAVDGETIIAHAATIRRAAHVEGTASIFGQSVDAMTHPDWQKRGLNQRLNEALRPIHEAAGIEWVYGFSNEVSTRIVMERQGRRSLGPFPLLARPLRGGIGAIARLGRSPEPPAPHPADIPNDIDALAEDAQRWHAVGVRRDHDHLSWRYRRPGGCYHAVSLREGEELVGFGVLAIRNQGPLRAAFVAEALVGEDTPERWKRLTRALLERARGLRCDVMVALGCEGSRVRGAWTRAGLKGVPEWLQPERVAFSIRPAHAQTPATESVYDPSRWHLCWGEHDLV
jgi:predicted N-acetyltransferase YhbS